MGPRDILLYSGGVEGGTLRHTYNKASWRCGATVIDRLAESRAAAISQ